MSSDVRRAAEVLADGDHEYALLIVGGDDGGDFEVLRDCDDDTEAEVLGHARRLLELREAKLRDCEPHQVRWR